MAKADRPGLILHVGTQKTGTTTIQGFLKNMSNELAVAGLHYLKTGRTNIAHNVMIQMIRKGRGPGLAKRILKEMDPRAPVGAVRACATDVGGVPLFEQAFCNGVGAAEWALHRANGAAVEPLVQG